jgi:hypothetical protein
MLRAITFVGAVLFALSSPASAVPVTFQINPGETWRVDFGQEHLIVVLHVFHVFDGETPGSINVEGFGSDGLLYGGGGLCFGICELYGDFGDGTSGISGIQYLIISASTGPWAIDAFGVMCPGRQCERVEQKAELLPTPIPPSALLFGSVLCLLGLAIRRRARPSGTSPTSAS